MSLNRIKKSLTVKPEPREQRSTRASRHDSWRNLATNLGVQGADKRLAGEVLVTRYRQADAEQLWEASDLADRIITTVPNEMTREGWRLGIDGEPEKKDAGAEIAKKVCDHLDGLSTDEQLNEALCFQRAYGGGAVLIGVDDGMDPGRPLDEKRIKPGSLTHLLSLTPRECTPVAWYDNPRAPKFGLPKIYQVVPDANVSSSAMFVHETRLLKFMGATTSRRTNWLSQNGWGNSVFVRVGSVLRDYDVAYDSGFGLVNDFAQAILKIKGLADMVASDDPDDARAFGNRIKAFDYTRSNLRTALLDAEGEDYERKTTSVAGLPDLFNKFDLRLAAAADMPVTLLMGQSPSGMNATGASDIRFFYDRVAARQRTLLRPQLNTLVRLAMKSLGLAEPESWMVQFNPLWQLDGLQQATMRKTNAETDQIEFNIGAISPHEVRQSRHGSGEYGTEIHLDAETQDALDAPDLTDEGEPKPVQTPRIATGGPAPKVDPKAEDDATTPPAEE